VLFSSGLEVYNFMFFWFLGFLLRDMI
jgi:hypothetical protein